METNRRYSIESIKDEFSDEQIDDLATKLEQRWHQKAMNSGRMPSEWQIFRLETADLIEDLEILGMTIEEANYLIDYHIQKRRAKEYYNNVEKNAPIVLNKRIIDSLEELIVFLSTMHIVSIDYKKIMESIEYKDILNENQYISVNHYL